MSSMQVGQRVKVKENAYEGSNEPHDFTVRGTTGTIAWDLGGGAFEVEIDGDLWPLSDDEIELIQD